MRAWLSFSCDGDDCECIAIPYVAQLDDDSPWEFPESWIDVEQPEGKVLLFCSEICRESRLGPAQPLKQAGVAVSKAELPPPRLVLIKEDAP